MRAIGIIVAVWMAAAGADAATLRERAERTILPSVQFREAAVPDVIEHLREASRSLDPAGDGINIVYRVADDHRAPTSTMSLRRISLLQVIQYVTEITGLHYRVDEQVIIISDRPAAPGRIVTRIYPVMPTIMDVIQDR